MVLYDNMMVLPHAGVAHAHGQNDTMHALLFDLDDTLYDLSQHRRRHLQRAWQAWLNPLPIHTQHTIIEAAVSERIFFRDMPDFLTRHGVTDVAENAHLCATSRDTWFADLQLDAGVADCLDALKSRYRLGLITNGPSWTQRAKILQLQLARWFEVMIVSEEFGVHKPDAAIFHHALAQLAVTAADTVMIGDNPDADIRGAHAVGMRAVWVQHPHQSYPVDLAPPWRCVTHVRDLVL